MGNHELLDGNDQPREEFCSPNHFYAAYIFDQIDTHLKDISTLIGESQRLGYLVRYWWLSQAMNIEESPDRLIVCVHHPTNNENVGMDLYGALQACRISYDELNAAALGEYVLLGRRVAELGDIHKPGGIPLFESR